MVKKRFVVEGVRNVEDAKNVARTLEALEGIEDVYVDPVTKLAEVLSVAEISTDELNKALDILGGNYSLVAARDYASTGGEQWERFVIWIPLILIGAFLLGLVVVMLLWGWPGETWDGIL